MTIHVRTLVDAAVVVRYDEIMARDPMLRTGEEEAFIERVGEALFLEVADYDDLIERGLGVCDECGKTYNLADREDHCVEEGLCWEHCADEASHYAQQRAEIDEIIEGMQ